MIIINKVSERIIKIKNNFLIAKFQIKNKQKIQMNHMKQIKKISNKNQIYKKKKILSFNLIPL